VTLTAGWEKIFSADPKLGFLSHAGVVSANIAAGTIPAGVQTLTDAGRLVMNDYIDAGVAAFFLLSVIVIIVASAHEWITVLTGRKIARSTEVEFRPSTADTALAS
jgi:carbon starvation protein